MTAVTVFRRPVCSPAAAAASLARRTLSSYARCRASAASRAACARAIESRMAPLSTAGDACGTGAGAGATSGFLWHAPTIIADASTTTEIERPAARGFAVIEDSLLRMRWDGTCGGLQEGLPAADGRRRLTDDWRRWWMHSTRVAATTRAAAPPPPPHE